MVVAVVALGPGVAGAIERVSPGPGGGRALRAASSDGWDRRRPRWEPRSSGAVTGILPPPSLAVVLLLASLLTFYLLRDGRKGWERVSQPSSGWQRGELETTMRDSIGVLGGYMGGTAVISAVGAVSPAPDHAPARLPFAVPVAILSFFACFIPYVGGFITTGLAFLIAVAYGDVSTIVIMGIYTVVFNIVQGNVVTPLVYRARSTSTPPSSCSPSRRAGAGRDPRHVPGGSGPGPYRHGASPGHAAARREPA